MVTWMQDSRPDKLTIGVILCVESNFQVQNIQKLHLDLNIQEKRAYAHLVLNLSVFIFISFPNTFTGLYSETEVEFSPMFLPSLGHSAH